MTTQLQIARTGRISDEIKAAAEKEKAEAVEREKAAKQNAIDAEARRVEQEKQAKINAENARIATEAQAIKAKNQAKIDAESAAEAARVAEVNRQAEAKRVEDDAQAAREANKRIIGKVRREAKEALMALGLNEGQAKCVVLAINGKEIPHISIKY